jgi:hypothetical protein
MELMSFPLFKFAAFILEDATADDMEPVKAALDVLHKRYRNKSPFSKVEMTTAQEPMMMLRLLARIGILPPYDSNEALVKRIMDFANSGGKSVKDKTTTDITRYVDSSRSEERTIQKAVQYHDVKNNPRYKPRDITGDDIPETFCNIYVSDFMRTLGVPLPHVINADGDPVPSGTRGAMALGANNTAVWLATHGGRFGWKKTDEVSAQAAANSGTPALVIAPGKKHIAVVVPGQITDNGATIAQAGKSLLEGSHVADGFGKDLYKSGTLEYWINTSKENKLLVA